MLFRSLLATTAIVVATAAAAQDIVPVVDTSTDRANDLRGVAYAADGKILVSGHRGDDKAETVVVVGRFNADGTPDETFGDGGFVEVDLGAGRVEQSYAVAELSDGDVVAAVNATEADGGISVYLLRFDPKGVQRTGDWGGDTGALEVVFGWPNAKNDSFPGVETPPQDTAWDLKVDHSGGAETLVVAGHGAAPEGSGRTDNDRYVVRLLASDGSPDPAFNGGAPFSYHTAQALPDGGRRILVEEDGAILSAGYTALSETLRNHVVLIRLNPDGTLDSSFGGFVDPASSGEAVGLVATPGVAVFNPFVADGGFAECYAVVKLSDGSYVTTGYGAATAEGVPSTTGFLTTVKQDIVSFRVDGTALSTNWGHDGRQAIQSEGRGLTSEEDRGRQIISLGGDRTMQIGRFGGTAAVVVLDGSGMPDTSVSGDGIIELPSETVAAQFFGVAQSPDGERLALTTNSDPAGARLVVLELN